MYPRPRSNANGPWQRPGSTSDWRHRKSPRPVRIPGHVTLPREAWPRLKEAFEGARALALDARPAYFAEVCNGDEALRHEVELLLAHGDQAASFLETPAMPFDDSLVAKSLEGSALAPTRSEV